MTVRRYIGRATGHHRGKRSWAFTPTPTFWLLVAAGVVSLAAVIVWMVNPGSDVPGDEKGSVTPSSSVMPDTSDDDESPSPSTGL